MASYQGYFVRGFDPITRGINDEHLLDVNLKTSGSTVNYDALKKLPPGHEIALELNFTERPHRAQLEIISRCLTRNRITSSWQPTIVKAKDSLWEVYYTAIQRNEIVRIPKALEEINSAMRHYDGRI